MSAVEKKLKDDLQNAVFSYRQAELEHRSIQATMERLKWKIEYISSLLGSGEPSLFNPARTAAAVASLPPPSENGTFEGKTTPEVIEAIMRKTGGKMRVPDLVNVAMQSGYGGPNADRKRLTVNFASILARAAQKSDHPIKKVGRGLFAIKDSAPIGHN
jgi:hypothetical protein